MSLSRQGISEIPYICKSHGITHAVISPGSRNAPLIQAFVSNQDMKCVSITDERSAGYFALGMSQQLNEPVVLLCTSGTALANYAPALAEAVYLGVPLIVFSADRPPEWIDQNDGQTIRQNNIFPNIVKESYTLPVETEKESDLWYFRRIINQAIHNSFSAKAGPVHINVPLREPLYNTLPEVKETPEIISVVTGKPNLTEEQWGELTNEWSSYQRKIIICGFIPEKNISLEKLLIQMSLNNEIVVVSENLSNLYHENFIHNPEAFVAALSKQAVEQFRPDLVVSMGGAIVSKRLKKYLRKYNPAAHWHIDEHDLFVDTYQALNKNIRVNPETFFAQIKGAGKPNPEYTIFCNHIKTGIARLHNSYLSALPFSDLKAYEIVLQSLPDNCNLHLANSTPVRYAQLFPSRTQTDYFSNRGTSGIDGCVSTAAGAASVTDKLNFLLLGDLAFIYDSNGLWSNSKLPNNLRIIVFDNGGGNIFKLIETGPGADIIRPFIETPHNVDISEICKAFGIAYLLAGSESELRDNLAELIKPNRRSVVLHIQTSGDVSAKTFKQYFQYISKNDEHKTELDKT